ncbi:NAD(P)-dependent oxidoreductase [Streptomyces sp. NPDC058326]|uniref:NAD(P)-dependent oxidoreductase n=1 Tax=Streptomyces sp. NPDC058326 TaxID=3346447 RepID=UPI0036EA1EA1
MRLTVFGASGGTGHELVRQGLAAGHHVTAVVRDPARIASLEAHPALTVFTAELTGPEALRPAVRDADLVISALGVRSNEEAGVVAPATAAVLAAIDPATVRRFLAISASPVGPPAGEEEFYVPIQNDLKALYADLTDMEERIREDSPVAWTVVRPPQLVDEPLTTKYRTEFGGSAPRGMSISRADLAHALLTLAQDERAERQVVGVAY